MRLHTLHLTLAILLASTPLTSAKCAQEIQYAKDKVPMCTNELFYMKDVARIIATVITGPLPSQVDQAVTMARSIFFTEGNATCTTVQMIAVFNNAGFPDQTEETVEIYKTRLKDSSWQLCEVSMPVPHASKRRHLPTPPNMHSPKRKAQATSFSVPGFQRFIQKLAKTNQPKSLLPVPQRMEYPSSAPASHTRRRLQKPSLQNNKPLPHKKNT